MVKIRKPVWLALAFMCLLACLGLSSENRDRYKRAIDNLKSEYPEVRRLAAETLGILGDPNAVEPLVVCLKDENSDVRQCAAEALTNLKWIPSDEQMQITYLIAKRNWESLAMGNWGDPCTVGTLVACLRDKNEYVRQSAARALGKIGKPAVEPLIACLKDEDLDVCRGARDALVIMGKPSVEPLIACLKDERSDVRQDVAEALGKLGDVNAVDPLVVCLKDEDSDVRQCAAEALTKLKWTPLDEQTRITFIIATRNWQDIVKIDKPAVLVECIKDKNPVVRQCAAEAMGNLGDPCTVGTLIACLRDKNEYVRQSAVLALGKFGKPAVEPLIACLKDEDWPVRESAAEMLGKIGDPRAVEPLIDALPDWEMDVKIVEALRKLDWQPKTDREKIYLWICKKDGKSLREHWEQAEKVLMEDVSSGEKRRVENTVFTVISLGKEEMIDKSIQVLDQQGDKGMAEVYLNCGNSRLRQAAEKWARSHGYPILNGAGRNDASWGKW